MAAVVALLLVCAGADSVLCGTSSCSRAAPRPTTPQGGHTIVVPPAAPSATVTEARADAGGTAVVSLPPQPARTFRVPDGDASWIARLTRPRGFRAVDLEVHGTLHVTWLQHAARTVLGAAPNPDDPANHPSDVELSLEGDRKLTFALGPHSGDVTPLDATLCKRAGWRAPPGDDWTMPNLDSLASSFSVGNWQGSDDFLLVHAGRALHVMHRRTGDGLCEPKIRQGPLEVCRDEPFEHVAEVRLKGADPDVDEAIQVETGAGPAWTPFDCGAATDTVQLQPPPGPHG
jgi:hypothetical protein